MGWKIFFWILCVFAFILAIGYGINPDIENIANYWYATPLNLSLITSAILYIGYYYALGWNKKIYPKWLIYLGFMEGLLCSLFVLVLPFIFFSAYLAENSVSIIEFLLSIIILIMFAVIPFLLLCFPLIKYLKKYDSLKVVDKPFFKIYTISTILLVPFYLFVILEHLESISKFNMWDYFYLLIIPIFTVIFFIGFSFDKKIFNKTFWKFSIIPFILLSILSYLFMSEVFGVIVKLNKTDIVFDVAMFIFKIYILIKYTFDDKIFNNELKIEEKINE